MKKCLLSFAICFSFVLTQFAFADMSVTVLPQRTLSIDISNSTNYDQEYASVAIMPYFDEIEDIQITNSTIENTLYITRLLDENGDLNISVSLSDNFEDGQYCVISHDNTGKMHIRRIGILSDDFDISHVNMDENNDVASLQSLIPTVFNVHNETFTANKDAICKYILNNKPHTKESFVKSYLSAEAVCRYLREEISFDEFFEEYETYINVNYDETFGTLSEQARTEAGRLFSQRMQTKIADIENTLNNIYEVVEMKICGTWSELSQVYIPNALARGIDTSKYDGLSQYNKESVFRLMLSGMSSVTKLEDIDGLFAKAIETVKLDPTIKDSISLGGGGGSGGGGGGAAAPNSISKDVDVFMPQTDISVAPSKGFADTSGHWAEKYIIELSERGVINGYDDKSFKPDNTITRAEFIHMICKLFDVKKSGNAHFSDVRPTDWHYESICSAYEAKLINGYENSFNPDGFITREDAAVILGRVLKLGTSGEVGFSDKESIADYALNDIVALSQKGIINGYPDKTFRPKGNISRAEVTSMVIRASEAMEK